ncbi:recG-like helicase [Firmicutes bacterium CAG:475]|nr:recG-like helicase [Firmicutes bacterium CAG:475]
MLTLRDVKGVGDATIKKLHDLDIHSVFEVFSFLPRKYIDLKEPIKVLDAEPNQLCLLEGRVESLSGVTRSKTKSFFVVFSDNLANNKVYFKAMFYNMPFLHDGFSIGQSYRLLTRLTNDIGSLTVVNPSLEKIERISKLDGIYTLYPLGSVMGQNAFKNIVYSALDNLKGANYEGSLAKVNKDLALCFEAAHRPTSLNIADRAIDSLASIDLAIVLSIYRKLRRSTQKSRKVFYNFENFRILDYVSTLNFEPTDSQFQAFEDIFSDMNGDKYMSRIVSGDVGSGKTAVAFFAMYAAVKGGKQAALMVPTEILAKQHAKKFAQIASDTGIRFALLTSSLSQTERRKVLAGLKNGYYQCVIGTNSLVSDDVEYQNLALAVIDEQHRFGVNDRARLEQKGAVDVLSLTATPIPRSMALTFYEDIAISHIKKREEAETNVSTKVYDDLHSAVDFVIDKLKRGKQAFIVCPSIVDAEGNNLMSIESFLRDFGNLFGDFSICVMHGKLKNDEKEQAMADFSSGKTQLLIATTVIEVGIDTKASEILILNADRFGLSSLHQLRGRVGRDGSEAHCLLHSLNKGERAIQRLETLEKSNDGQYLAEMDFAMRGAGDFLGVKQSGRSLTPIFSLQINAQILSNAKEYAEKNLSNLSLSELLALTRTSKSGIDDFLAELGAVTLNS